MCKPVQLKSTVVLLVAEWSLITWVTVLLGMLVFPGELLKFVAVTMVSAQGDKVSGT